MDTETLEMIKRLIASEVDKAIKEERSRLAMKIMYAEPRYNDFYHPPVFSFEWSMTTLAQEILKDD